MGGGDGPMIRFCWEVIIFCGCGNTGRVLKLVILLVLLLFLDISDDDDDDDDDGRKMEELDNERMACFVLIGGSSLLVL